MTGPDRASSAIPIWGRGLKRPAGTPISLPDHRGFCSEAVLGDSAVSMPLRRIDAAALLRLLRFGLAQGATGAHFRVGSPPRYSFHAGERTLRYRQLAREDTEAIVRLLFEQARVPERLGNAPGDAAQQLSFFYEMPGEALFEIDASREAAGLAVSVEIIRPLTDPSEIALLET
jgi:hypothetical protein